MHITHSYPLASSNEVRTENLIAIYRTCVNELCAQDKLFARPWRTNPQLRESR